jgi:hypothetical protein
MSAKPGILTKIFVDIEGYFRQLIESGLGIIFLFTGSKIKELSVNVLTDPRKLISCKQNSKESCFYGYNNFPGSVCQRLFISLW